MIKINQKQILISTTKSTGSSSDKKSLISIAGKNKDKESIDRLKDQLHQFFFEGDDSSKNETSAEDISDQKL